MSIVCYHEGPLYQEKLANITVYQKRDIVKQPMKKGSFLPKKCTRGGVGHAGVVWVMQGGLGGYYRGGVGHAGVGWG